MSSRRPHTFSEYLSAARFHTLLIITTAIVFAVAAGLALKRQANVYEASTTIAVESKNGETADPARRLASLQQQLTNRARLEALIAKPGLFDEAKTDGAVKESLIAVMQTGTRVSESGENCYRIASRASDPATAAKIANALAEGLTAPGAKDIKPTALPVTPSSAETDALRQRAIDLSARLSELEEKSPWLLALKDAAPVASAAPAPRSAAPSAEDQRAQQLTIESLKDRQYLLQQQLTDTETRLASVRQMVEQEKKGSTLRDNPTYATLINRRTELEGQRDTLINRQELTEKHPRVAAITDQIAAINRQIDELRKQDANQASQSPESRELRSLESEHNRLKLELEINNRELARRSTVASAAQPTATPAPARDSASSPVAQQYFGLKRNYEEVLARLDAAEGRQPATSSAPSEALRVLEPATEPQQPVSPNRWLIVAGAFFAGLALGAVFAIFAESRRFAMVQDSRDVDFYTRMPLLATIPKTITNDERKKQSRRAVRRLALGTALAVVATVALTAVFVATHLFSLISRG
jgi:capsular polysaccharide biosynthesis protein